MRKRYIPCLCKARALLEALPQVVANFSLLEMQEGHVLLTENRTRQHIQQSLKIFYHYPRAKFQKNHTRILRRDVLILFWTNCAHWYAHHCRTVRLFFADSICKKALHYIFQRNKAAFHFENFRCENGNINKA